MQRPYVVIGIVGAAVVIAGISIIFLFVAPNVSASSMTEDPINDAAAVRIHETGSDPVVQPRHDIVRSSVKRMNGELQFSMELLGDPNANSIYETVYIWIIDYPTIMGNQRYTIIVPHLPDGFAGSTGWHMAVFDNNRQQYVLPLTRVADMQRNTVEVTVDTDLIGNPAFFWWQSFVMVRVEPQFDRPPDFLIDSAPDNTNVLLGPFS